MIPLFFVYYFEYAINSGISATLVFDGWGSDKVYKYYGLMYQIGTHLSFLTRARRTRRTNGTRTYMAAHAPHTHDGGNSHVGVCAGTWRRRVRVAIVGGHLSD
jgi:hypothetical protein